MAKITRRRESLAESPVIGESEIKTGVHIEQDLAICLLRQIRGVDDQPLVKSEMWKLNIKLIIIF